MCYEAPYSAAKNLEATDGDLRNPYTEDGHGAMRRGEIVFSSSDEFKTCSDWLFVQDSAYEDFYTSVPSERRILFVSEPPMIRKYDEKYLKQFGVVVSPYRITGYTGRLVIHNPCIGWFVGMGIGGKASAGQIFKKLSDVEEYGPPCKTRQISVVSSLKHRRDGHRKRLEFIEALMRRYGGKIDYYGRGFGPLSDKLDALAPYKYHIAIENSALENYWTEKLTDAWIAWCLPIYFGDPSIKDKVPDPDGVEVIDIRDISGSLNKIGEILYEDPYNSRLDAIARCRSWAIKESNPYEAVCRIVKSASDAAITTPRLNEEQLIIRPARSRRRVADRLREEASAVSSWFLARRVRRTCMKIQENH
jgi:hypothetical protein